MGHRSLLSRWLGGTALSIAWLAGSLPAAAQTDEFKGWNAVASRDGWQGDKNPDENLVARRVAREKSRICYIVIHTTGSGELAEGIKRKVAAAQVAREPATATHRRSTGR